MNIWCLKFPDHLFLVWYCILMWNLIASTFYIYVCSYSFSLAKDPLKILGHWVIYIFTIHSLCWISSYVSAVSITLFATFRLETAYVTCLLHLETAYVLLRRLNHFFYWFEGRKEVETWGRESQLLSHLLRSGWTSLTLSFPAHSATMGAVLSAVCECQFSQFSCSSADTGFW